MSSYKESQWAIFRKGVIELDGHKCTNCGRGEDEVVLQVHHKKYVTGLKAWEYPTADCITLCKGCHAEEHGKIQPQYDWECIGKEDLGDLIGTCDNCGSSMRYSFTVFHPQRGTVNVGITCCNNLTDSKIATSFKESRLKFESRKKSFITSTRWKLVGGVYKIKQGLFNTIVR